jgi:two-component system chemotaxis response regulator CheY
LSGQSAECSHDGFDHACIKALIAEYPKIDILVVSALNDKATAIQALKQGARGFLTKPFTDKQLVDALLEFVH